MIIDQKYIAHSCDLYGIKLAQHEILFNGYLRIALQQINIDHITNDVTSIIYKYYNCYNQIQTSMVSKLLIRFMERLLFLISMENGYPKAIKNQVIKCLSAMIPNWDSRKMGLFFQSKYNLLIKFITFLIGFADI